MTEGVSSYISLFSDDAKYLKKKETTRIVRSYSMKSKMN